MQNAREIYQAERDYWKAEAVKERRRADALVPQVAGLEKWLERVRSENMELHEKIRMVAKALSDR